MYNVSEIKSYDAHYAKPDAYLKADAGIHAVFKVAGIISDDAQNAVHNIKAGSDMGNDVGRFSCYSV